MASSESRASDPLSILVVDDEPFFLRLVERILSAGGYRIEVANEGDQALEVLQRSASGIDVLLTDLRMPGMPGWVLAERARDRWPHLAVVFMSSEPHLLPGGGDHGAEVLPKPFTPSELESALVAVRAVKTGEVGRGRNSIPLTKRLQREADRLAETWRDLLARLGLGPEELLPLTGSRGALIVKATLEAGPPTRAVVPALAGDPPGDPISPEVRELLREICRLRRAAGRTLPALLSEVDVLRETLFTELRSRAHDGGAPVELIQAAGDVSDGVHRLRAALTEMWAEAPDVRREFDTLELYSKVLGHEIRDPLNAAMFGSEALLDVGHHLASDEWERIAATIPRNLARIQELLDAVRVMVESDAAPVPSPRAHIDSILRGVVDGVGPAAEAQGVRVIAQEPLPPFEADTARLQLVLRNLLSNAVKYSDPGKENRWVRVTARVAGDGSCHVEVSDNGVGIDEADQEHVFERFYRGGASPDDGGSGLGLAIASEAARQFGGAIHVTSSPGEGSTFTVVIPPA